MLKKIFYIIPSLHLVFICTAQDTILLYENYPPGSEGWDYDEIEFNDPNSNELMVRNVVHPSLTVYRAKKHNFTGTAIVVCPGGGNIWLSFESEGAKVAEWLARKGITAFVLKYRLNKTVEPVKEFNKIMEAFLHQDTSMPGDDSLKASLNSFATTVYNKYFGGDDGVQALKYVRQHAKEYGINSHKVGIMGFSAGARVAMHVTLNSAPDNLPNFTASIYGGRLPNIAIPENAPPLFILCAADDPIAEGSPGLSKNWKAAGCSAELHIYSKGGHRFGMNKQNMPVDTWIHRLYDWMKTNNF